MTETVTIDRPSVAKPVSRPRSRKPATVSASALAVHLDVSRTYIGKLETEGVIQRQGDGFPLDQSRIAYLRFLRRERKQSPRGEATASFEKAKTELIRLRIEQRKRILVSREEANACIDFTVGLFLTKLSGLAARASRDLAVRRSIDAVIYEIRREVAEECTRLADANGEALEPQDDAA
jgi:hypothetical protein